MVVNRNNQEIQEIDDGGTIQPENMSSGGYPNHSIKIERDQYSIYELKRRFDRGSILIAPEFQREDVWKTKQKSELIESVIMGIPIPLIYLAEDADGRLVVVDGRQRLTTFFKYLDNKFALNKLNILTEINKYKFDDLGRDFPKFQATLEDFQLIVQIIKYPTPDRVRFDIFDRVNRGGTSLNNQEMRNALYQGNSTKLLKKLSKNQEFLKATGNSINPQRMKDRYVILRALTFFLWKEGKLIDKKDKLVQYKSDTEDFLGSGMEYLNRASIDVINELECLFIESMMRIYIILGNDAFRIPEGENKKRPISMALFECLAYVFMKNRYNENEKNFKLLLEKKIIEDEKFFKSLTYNVDSINNVNKRFDVIESIYEEVTV